MILVGTSWGDLHILDHEGNVNSHQKFPKHIVGINQISVEEKGEFAGTCSDDGQASESHHPPVEDLIRILLVDSHKLSVR